MTSELRSDLRELGRVMFVQGLTWGNAGNISARADEESFWISASGTQLDALGPKDLALCPVHGQVATLSPKPSKEVPMHQAIYQERPEVGAVLHGAPFYSTLVACSDLEIPANLFVENMYYLARVARVPYAHPGSTELGELVRVQSKNADVLLLENHGVLVYDKTLSEALVALQVLELSCRMLIAAQGAGVDLKSLPEHTVKDFLDNANYKPRRSP